VKNEEHTIIPMLRSVAVALKYLDKSVKVETLVCINGTTDNTEKVIKGADNWLCAALNLKVIHSEPGILPAERKIATARKLKGFLLFCDADITIGKFAIRELYHTMLADKNLMVVYGKVMPKFQSANNNFSKMLKSYYKMQYLLPERKCFHGRLFMMRNDNDLMEKHTLRKAYPKALKDLHLELGAISDDIVLSAAVVHKYGFNSIKRVDSAKVYFYPPDNFYDLFLGIRRYTIETERVNLLFPEYRKINESPEFARQTKIVKPTMRKRDKFTAELFMEFENFISNLIKDYEIYNKKPALWATVKSSKPKLK
jgi:hypothetical protein